MPSRQPKTPVTCAVTCRLFATAIQADESEINGFLACPACQQHYSQDNPATAMAEPGRHDDDKALMFWRFCLPCRTTAATRDWRDSVTFPWPPADGLYSNENGHSSYYPPAEKLKFS